ncbi:MAG: tetratricopeptide repeat protein [Omnitrophica bacterium]|nr:tetratricopeptide repeat protein [Candidatus Omnitrophota bacterium]
MAKNALKSLLVSISLILLTSCSIPPTYSRKKIAKTLKEICRKEFDLDIEINAWDSGETLWIYAPVKLIDESGQFNYDEKNKRWNDDLLKDMRKIYSAINKVLLSIDRPPKFYCLITSDIEKIGLDWYTLVFLDDERKYTMQSAVGYISSQQINQRIVSFNFRDSKALGDKTGAHIHTYDIPMGEFISLLAEQKLAQAFASIEVSENFRIRDLAVDYTDNKLNVILDIMIKKYKEELPLPLEKAEEIIKELHSAYPEFAGITEVRISDVFNDKQQTLKFPKPKNYSSDTKRIDPGTKTLANLHRAIFYFSLGDDYYKEKKFKKAEEFYKRTVKILPGYVDALNTLGLFYLEINETKKALVYFEKTLTVDPDNLTAYENLGRLYIIFGQHEKGLSYLERILKIKPDYIGIYYIAGFAYSGLGQYKKALDYFQKSLPRYPHKEKIYQAIGETYHKLNQDALALTYYKQALAIKSDYPGIYLDIAETYTSLGDLSKAIINYEKTLAIDPDSFTAHYSLAEIYFLTKQYKKTITYCKKAIKVSPDFPQTYIMLGVAHNRLDPQKADIVYFKKALRLDPENFLAQYYLGETYLLLAQFDKALLYFKKTIKVNPDFADAYVGLGRSYLHSNQKEKARDNFKKAKELFRKQNNREARQEIEEYLRLIQ